MKKLWIIAILLSGLFFGTSAGVIGNAQGKPETDVTSTVLSYFPVDPQLNWIYEGEGIEFASFKRWVMYRENNRVQMGEYDGGTRTMKVFQVKPESITETFSMSEVDTDTNLLSEAANRSVLILQAPLTIGAVWEDEHYRHEVISKTEQLTVPAGSFTNVLKVKVTPLQQEFDAQISYEYYATDTGLVMREFIIGDNNFKVTSRLKSFQQPVTAYERLDQKKIGNYPVHTTVVVTGDISIKAPEAIEILPGDYLKVVLYAAGGTGYGWVIDSESLNLIEAVSNNIAQVNSQPLLVGGETKWEFYLRVKPETTGQETLHFYLSRPWEKNEKPAQVFDLTVVAKQ